jgi:hypothetical protein
LLILLNKSGSSSTFWSSVQDTVFRVLQIIDLRLALLIGLAAFLVAVSFDASGNPAEAADLVNQASLVPVAVTVTPEDLRPRDALATPEASLAANSRLRHGGLTSALMTSSRLTDAHFFTDLPGEP